MKRFSVIIILAMFSLLFVPLGVYAESGELASKPPPVAPALVREGDFASKLAGALNMGTAKNETEAESMLTGVGIAPRNGWISDYPMTPDIIVEVQKAIGDAADGKRLALGKEEALKAFRTTALELEIPMIAAGPSGYAEGSSPTAPQYADPSVVANYYYDEGPPIYSYYPPPPDYAYLYAWVPFPFFWTGFFFPGFFILNDFDRCFFVHGHSFVVSNHFFDHHHHRFSTVNPVNRWRGGRESLRAAGDRSGRPGGRGFATAQARRGAESILQRSHQQMTASRGPAGRNFGTSRSPGAPSFNGRGGSTAQVAPRQNFRGFPGGSGRSFSPPSSRSISPPSMAGRSYSGGFQGGGGRAFSGGFSGGGFNHGGSSGGFHGGGFGGHR